MSSSVEHFVAQQAAATLPGSDIDWLAERRGSALDVFKQNGLPQPRDEEWKYTRIAPIEKRAFVNVPDAAALSLDDIAGFVCTDMTCSRLVFVDGVYSDALSDTVGEGVTISSLSSALERDAASVEPYLGKLADAKRSGFTALSAAYMADGAYIHVGKNSDLEQPVHLLFVTTQSGEGAFTQPRNLIVAEANSRARVLESYVSLTAGSHFTNAVTEVALAENAEVEHIKLQDESVKAFHVGAIEAHVARNARFHSHALSFGAQLARHDINAWLDDDGAECLLNGLYMVDGRQHVDFHTTVDHAKPNGISREFYKGILGGHSRGVFNGRVHVHPDAQKTDSEQANKNLLLSRNAEVDTKPELEIYADDVKCAHGATVGQLDETMLFYLRSRGIDKEAARGLLTYGFAQDIIERISLEPVKAQLEKLLVARVPDAEHVKEMV